MSEALIPVPPGLARAQVRLSKGPKWAGTGRLTAGLTADAGLMEVLAALGPAPEPPPLEAALPAARVDTWAFPLRLASELEDVAALVVPWLPLEAVPAPVFAAPPAGTCLDEAATGLPCGVPWPMTTTASTAAPAMSSA